MDVDLARRLVACPGWRWLPCCPWMRKEGGGLWSHGVCQTDTRGVPPIGAVPVISSPAVPGLVLHLVRLAWGEPHAFVQYTGEGGWTVVRPDGSALTWGTTGGELEALCLALESAPTPAAPA
jgi:hypothetical protein